MAALLWMALARVLGPSDTWDHTQPKTISYTTDIIVHGGSHWILPIERGELPASKPPLYNWLAVPFVKLLGFQSELGHKFPSLIAICLCWLIMVRLGRRLDTSPDQAVGWVAGIALVSNETMFKLGYLARPDMVLTLWLLMAWYLATTVMVRHRRFMAKLDSASVNYQGGHQSPRASSGLVPSTASVASATRSPWLAAAFWACITLAALSKGPAAVVGIAYAAVAARVIGGSWRAIGLLYPVVGLLMCLVVVGAWIYGVWKVDAHHLTQVLWHNEIFGRITGTGPNGIPGGWRAWIKTFPYFGLYYLLRFFPWSAFSILAMIEIWRRRRTRAGEPRGWRKIHGDAGAWLCGAAIMVVLVVGLFTLSTGKRADYIAAAFPPGSLLAAWWLMRVRPFVGVRWPWLAPIIACVILSILTIIDVREGTAPSRNYGHDVTAFIEQTSQELAARPGPVAFCFANVSHLQARLGYSLKDGQGKVFSLLNRETPFWVIAGQPSETEDFAQWLMARKKKRIGSIEPVVVSPPLAWRGREIERLTLYRIQPLPLAKPPATTTPAESSQSQ